MITDKSHSFTAETKHPDRTSASLSCARKRWTHTYIHTQGQMGEPTEMISWFKNADDVFLKNVASLILWKIKACVMSKPPKYERENQS